MVEKDAPERESEKKEKKIKVIEKNMPEINLRSRRFRKNLPKEEEKEETTFEREKKFLELISKKLEEKPPEERGGDLEKTVQNFEMKPTNMTLIIEGGKKDKVRAGDLLGALTGDAGLKGSSIGKIDIYDKETNAIIERKTKVNKIYDGYLYQIYAQYFCMTEMGYKIEKLFIHSLKDNKRYKIKLPTKKEVDEFENLLYQIRNFDIHNPKFTQNPKKCQQCIYSELCNTYIS